MSSVLEQKTEWRSNSSESGLSETGSTTTTVSVESKSKDPPKRAKKTAKGKSTRETDGARGGRRSQSNAAAAKQTNGKAKKTTQPADKKKPAKPKERQAVKPKQSRST